MTTMGVCDACGMLVRLGADGRCPNGHPASGVHDTFETRASSSASSGMFAPDRSEFDTQWDRPPAQGTGGVQPAPRQTPPSPPTPPAPGPPSPPSGETAAQQQARAVKRVGLVVVGVFVAIQLITMCGGLISALLAGR